ncbi:desi-like protein at4g17486 [Phtheirospermum japonicum]|uniref:Desi-like protein at4g17486 n=1 Tax=Phtheirospermum japonicum TaxID=374723 RepID=A0A830BK88_9LAMI|nr:desi-like protein at4g17486 [Phtheirospermum japonicum]
MKKMMLCRMIGRKRKTGTVPVYLNVYDLTPMNGYAYWLGLGIYHSGVQVHGVEYAFGAHEHSTTGIFEVEPKRCPGFTFRKSILIGRSDLGLKEVRAFMEKLAEEYSGNTYNLITKNCNHFCNDVCLRLTGKSIPRWVNRLARLGLFCNCVLPAGLNETKEALEREAVDTDPDILHLRFLRLHCRKLTFNGDTSAEGSQKEDFVIWKN